MYINIKDEDVDNDIINENEYVQEFKIWWNKLMIFSDYEQRCILKEYKTDIYQDYINSFIVNKSVPN